MNFNAISIAMPKVWLPPKILLVMKITTLLLIIGFTQVSAAAFSQRVTLNEKNASLEKVLKIIKKQSGFLMFYNDQDLKNANKVDADFKNASVEDALNSCFANQPLNYSIIDRTIVVQKKDASALDVLKSSLNISVGIKGKVTNEKGEPMPGVTVRVTRGGKNVNKTVSTTNDGSYYVEAEQKDVLIFSYIGYKNKEVIVYSQTPINISLEPEISGLEQVVVVGYGTTKRKDLIGSVASIDVKEIKDVPFATLDQALAGKAAGVQVVQSDGSPGGVAKIRIRGGTSILGGNDPLYIIDGVQVTIQNKYIQNSSEVSNPIAGRDIAGGSVSDAFSRGLNSLGGLNINDIESIDILKDASATAIYGSKAANGVIIITTKKGKYDQKPVLEGNYYFGFSTPKKLDLLNSDEYKMIMKEAAQNLLTEQQRVGRPADQVATNIVNDQNYLGNANTDWLNLVLRTSVTQNADLSVRGGGQNSRYYTSLSYSNMTGTVRGTDFQRLSGKINLDNSITSKLRVITNIDYGFTTQNITNGAYTQALLAPPTYAPYNADGSINTFTNEAGGAALSSGLKNPLALLNGINRGQTASLLGSLALEYDILKNLKFRSVASVNYSQYHQRNYNPGNALGTSGSIDDDGYANNGIAAQGQTETVSQLFENTLTYNQQFNESNRIDVVAGTSWQKDTNHSFLAQGQYFPDDFVLNDLSSSALTLPSTSSAGQNSLLSFYARVNYAFKERYLFTFTGRSDASSKFPRDNRTAIFPSGGVAWRLSQEKFLSKVSWIDDIKLRASIGYTGTQNIGDHLFRTLYSPGTYGGTNALYPSQLGNSSIKWESTLQKDAGITFSFFKSRITGEVGVYEKKTSGLLFGESLAPSSAYSSVIANIADISNKGLEIDLRGDMFRSSRFTWTGDINFSFNRSLVTNINKDFSDPNQSSTYIGNTIIREGQPIGLFYGSHYLGIIQTPAQLAAYKAQFTLSPYISPYLNIGDPMYEINPLGGFPSSELVIGNASPKFTGGYTNTFTYKGLSLITLFTYSYGGKIFYLSDFNNQNINDLSNKQTTILGRWTPQNPNTDRPRVIYTGNTVAALSNNNIYSNSYIKLKSIVLSYQLPKSVITKFKLQAASLYVSATNVFTITHYPGVDPEVSNDPYSLISGYSDSSGYPSTKTYTMGLRVSF
jgi:TonB-linked SusC/RagA family outer membrane protein